MPAILQATPKHPGAIAIIQIIGDESAALLRSITGVHDWPWHRLRLVNFADIDHGLAVRLNENVVQLMPHGGPRVVQRLIARLVELGAEVYQDSHALNLLHAYPEASDQIEAITLHALARAQSPLALDLLLDQPRRWRTFASHGSQMAESDLIRSQRLNRLIDPPLVVLAGLPNVGKSTLTNALFGRPVSIAYDMPGTTRDYTAGLLDLAGLTVIWHDTPGLRDTDDPIERRAIEVSQRLLHRADVVIAIRDAESAWPTLSRQPDLHVLNKCDLLQQSSGAAHASTDKGVLNISAKSGEGLSNLVQSIRDRLVPASDLEHAGVWLFDERLKR